MRDYERLVVEVRESLWTAGFEFTETECRNWTAFELSARWRNPILVSVTADLEVSFTINGSRFRVHESKIQAGALLFAELLTLHEATTHPTQRKAGA